MREDSLFNDSARDRPLPKWLTDQRDGLNAYQPEMVVMKEEHYLRNSFLATGIFVLLAVVLLSVYILRKNKKKSSI